jgi:hypothetical protein
MALRRLGGKARAAKLSGKWELQRSPLSHGNGTGETVSKGSGDSVCAMLYTVP